MSREVILSFADGCPNVHTPEFKAFLVRLGANVGKYKPEWLDVLGVGPPPDDDAQPDSEEEQDEDLPEWVEPRGWQMKAVLCVLAHMSMPGPEGGLPPIQAVCKAMLGKERSGGTPGTDEDWAVYFLKAFHREQKKYLAANLGEAGGGELRRRLMKALRNSAAQTDDGIHYGPKSATVMGVDAVLVAKEIGGREAGGNTKAHEGSMPTVGQLRELIQDVFEMLPGHAPSFPNWMAIACRVFKVGISHLPPTQDPNGGDDPEKGLVPDDRHKEEGLHGEWQASHADVSQVVSLIEDAIAELDGKPFPDGPHARTFVECLLFADRAGEIRVTQEVYAARTGISDSTVTNRRNAIFKAIRDNSSYDLDPVAYCEAIQRMQTKYLSYHLEIFAG